MGSYYVYILASRKDGLIYVGITNDLVRRVYEHKNEACGGFTKKYHIKKLVHYEVFPNPESAIVREKRLKEWRRSWKVELIERNNPDWSDIYEQWFK